MRGKVFFPRFSRYSSIMLICLLVMLLAFGCRQKTEDVGSGEQKKDVRSEEQVKELVFDMDEVSVFDVIGTSQTFFRGQSGSCYDKPRMADVAKYPRFKSDKPLYGSIRFGGIPAKQDAPGEYHFAIDESAGTNQGYDLLYFDQDCDGSLTNESPLTIKKNPPEGVMQKSSSIEQQVCFNSIDVNFDFGPDGEHSIEIMPRLMIRSGRSRLHFIATKVRKGQIDIDGAEYNAIVGYSFLIGRRFDLPGAGFNLIQKDDPQNPPRWWGADGLTSIHAIGGKHYRFATTPLGDKLIVRPYMGRLGVFEVGAGGRDIQDISITGSLRSKDTAVAIGGNLERGSPMPAKSCRLPVGDYFPAYVTVKLDRLQIGISNNYHSDRRSSGRELPVFGIKIRADRPCVLDFSNKPDVMFTSPEKDHRIKLGEQLSVSAVLIDPELDIMIRRLYNTGQERERVSLDPKVVITRADGEKVAEGVMPFG